MSKTILSWDIGIINLAYCIIEKNNNEINIKQWNKINILEEESNTYIPKCICKKKNNICCNKKAMYYSLDGEHKIYYCGSHKNTYIPKNILFNDITDNINCDYTTSVACKKKAKFQINNNNYCLSHKTIIENRLKKEIELKKIKKKSSTTFEIQYLAERIYKKLDEIPELLKVDKVLIENQVALKNPKMKTMSAFLYGYFIIRGIVDKEKTNSIIPIVKFKSASNKLKINEDKTIETFKNTKQSKHKKITKDLAIEYTKVLLKENDENSKYIILNANKWLDFLNTHKKQDDLSDCLLQGYHYLLNN